MSLYPAPNNQATCRHTVSGRRLSQLVTTWLLLGISTPALAYLDPGTGSMLVYFFIGLATTLVFTLREQIYRLTDFFRDSGSSRSNAHQPRGVEVLCYSEGGQYWNVFAGVIQELTRLGVSCAYYTSDADDPGLSACPPACPGLYIGKGHASYLVLNRLEVPIVVMTTPQLDILQLKRSPGVQHYCHLVHSPTDALMYKKFAFDYFDSVMCSGPHQIHSIRALESTRKMPNKQLFATGLTYYDTMLREKNQPEQQPNWPELESKSTILVAPTWGSNNLLKRFGRKPIDALLAAGYAVILRPHPQSYISDREVISQVIQPLEHQPGLIIDTTTSPLPAMAQAEYLLSDISGIIFDYAFIFEKPVLVADAPPQTGGFEAEDVAHQAWEFASLDSLTTGIDADNIAQLPDILAHIQSQEKIRQIRRLRAQSIYNFGEASVVAAGQLHALLVALNAVPEGKGPESKLMASHPSLQST